MYSFRHTGVRQARAAPPADRAENARPPLPRRIAAPSSAPQELVPDEFDDLLLEVFGDENADVSDADRIHLPYATEGDYPPRFNYIPRCRVVGKPRTKLGAARDPCQCDPKTESCGVNCINRYERRECEIATCPCHERCTNLQFQLKKRAPVVVRETPGRGWGLFAAAHISKGTFIMEYAGEIINAAEFKRRRERDRITDAVHFYFMQLTDKLYIDSSRFGNESRFINHSHRPNCIAEQWKVCDQAAIGIFALRDIARGSELTFDYQFVIDGRERQVCRCGEPNCTGYIGGTCAYRLLICLSRPNRCTSVTDIRRQRLPG